jgi:alkanesulfonate monooxygenase SsuD/methylene tetrahydromethanopterin reductase-like flavin-dependent oxidoreductase (luciferase family)
MRIGVSLTSSYNTSNAREGARWMVERARAARESGLDSLFVGDHHATPQPYYQNVPMMGRLLAEWGDRPFGCLFLLPLWHPVLLAEQIGTLASIGEGRFIIQCGLGYGEDQFQAMGTTMKHRPSRFEESLSILRRLLAGETVSSDGRWTFNGARIAPIPPEPVEVWVGASARVAIERAARLGDGFLAAPSLRPDQARRQLATYREACERVDRPVGTLAVRRDIFIGETSEEATRIAGPIVGRGYRGFPAEAPVYGSPREVADRFGELAEMGYTDVIVRNMADRQEHALSTLGLLGEVREQVARL